MKYFYFTLLIVLMLYPISSKAQNVGINSTGAAPDAGAALDVDYTNKGMLIPRVNINNLNTIAPIIGSTTESMLVYNTNGTTGTGFHYWDGGQWVRMSINGDAWSLTGNAGTNPGTNFLGTTDAQDLVFRTNNTERMRIFTGGQVAINNNAAFANTVLSVFSLGGDNGIVAESENGSALFGQIAAGGNGTGIVAFHNGNSGRAEEVVTNNAANADISLAVFNSGTAETGYFNKTNTTSANAGVFVNTNSTSTNLNSAGVWSQSSSIRGGVFLSSLTNNGTAAIEGTYIGGVADAIGVLGSSTPAAGWGYGVVGQGNWYGVYSFGDFGATGGKFFVIDHPLDPENKILKHANIESNEILNHYRGNVTLDGSGSAVIELPKYFKEININFSYNLTPVGAPMPNLHVSQEISGNQFAIAGGAPGMKVSWIVEAERNDKYMQNHSDSKNMEPNKKPYMKGKYLDPDSWGQPENKGVLYNQQSKKQDLKQKTQENKK